MIIEKKERKANRFNEDRIVIGKNYFLVIDGATPLVKNNVKPTEASWFAGFIKKNLKKNDGNLINKLNEISKKAYKQFAKISILNKKYFPSCALAWVEINNNKIVAHTIGDCEIVIKYKDNTLKRLLIEDLPKLDNGAIQQMVNVAKEKNISVKEARKHINDILIENRKLMNKPNGYSIFTIDNNPDFKFSTYEEDVNKIKEIYVYSDGISQAFDELKIYDSWEELFKNDVRLSKLIKRIVKKAKSDVNYNKYPRFKLIDDISIIKIVF